MPVEPLDVLSLAIAVMKNEPKNTSRKLAIEPLEDRRLLATVTVGNALDVTNGDTSSIAALEADNGGDGISLREAILAANNTAGADKITFDFGHDGPETILLTMGEIPIAQSVTVNGTGRNLLTIDAQQQSRIFNTPDPIDYLTIRDMTLTGGRVIGDNLNTYGNPTPSTNSGGALRADADVILERVTITGSSVNGERAYGGGATIERGTLTNVIIQGNINGGLSVRDDSIIRDSIISGNQGDGVQAELASNVNIYDSQINDNTERGITYANRNFYSSDFARVWLYDSIVSKNMGGGIDAHGVRVTRSIITGNHSLDSGGGIRTLVGYLGGVNVSDSIISGNTSEMSGGGIVTQSASITRSTIHGNSAASAGGGIQVIRLDHSFPSTITITDSSITDNRALGESARGGGVNAFNARAILKQSTISGNAVTGSGSVGGGIFGTLIYSDQSTITNNSAAGSAGGIGQAYYYRPDQGRWQAWMFLEGTIITGNTAPNQPNIDSYRGDEAFQVVEHNLLGTELGHLGGPNIFSDNPHFGPLANNGGPTQTHALLPGSPALNTGSPSELLTPFSVISDTSATDLFPASNLINDSGLSEHPTTDNYQSITHAIASTNSAWVTDQLGPIGSDYYDLAVNPVLTFYFVELEELSGLVLWGYLLTAPHNNEAKSFTLEFFTDRGTTFNESIQIEHLRTGGEQETIDFGQFFSANAVRMTITDNHFGTPGSSGGGRVGLGEVKFLAALDLGPYDQRGEGFARAVGSQIDIGAYESQGIPSFSPGDYNRDGLVNAADYTVWRDALGQTVTPGVGADGDGSGTIDAADYAIWRNHLGNGLQFNSGSGSSSSQLITSATDTAFAQFVNPPITSSDIQQPIESTTARPAPSLLLDGSEELLLLAGYQTDQSIDHNRDDFETLPDVEDESDTAGDLPPLAFRFDEFP